MLDEFFQKAILIGEGTAYVEPTRATKKSRHEDLSFRTQRFVQQAVFLSFSSSSKAPSPSPTQLLMKTSSSSAAYHLLFAAQRFFHQQIEEV
ncbi:hypothetical protein CEXT_567951 [Caerostris extrusa]|uniref:Uncharacterized protein n=1 Tax=Caerostris extrusa TaxID=172846 RepID=A0AAV4PUT5_CAEEX|nr:hypothetical protein CEXT_567951 [Caerostris extrusa]